MNIEEELREFRWTVALAIVFALLMVLGGVWARSDGELSARTNTTLFLMGLGLMGATAYSYFVLRTLFSWIDRILLVTMFACSLLIFFQAERVPGLDEGGLQFPIAAIVAAVMAFLGQRRGK